MAAALVPAATAYWAAAAALVLLAAFSLAVGRLLRRGERADCHCFGALHSTPATAASCCATRRLRPSRSSCWPRARPTPGPIPA